MNIAWPLLDCAKLFNFDPHATSETLEIFDNSTIMVDCSRTHSISIRGDNYSITPNFNIIEYQSSAIAGEEYNTHQLGGTNSHQSIVIDRMIYIIMRNKISLF